MRWNPTISLRASSRRCPMEWIVAASPTTVVKRMANAPRASTPRNPGPSRVPWRRTERAIRTAKAVSNTAAPRAAYSIEYWYRFCTNALASAAMTGMARRERIISVFGEAGHRELGGVDSAELAVHHVKKASGDRSPYGDIEGNGEFERKGLLNTHNRS